MEWIDIINYDGSYEVSDMGQIKSVGRFVSNGRGGERWIKEKILKPYIHKIYKEASVTLSLEGISKKYRIMSLVGLAFVGEKKEGQQYCRKNKIKTDNRAENIIITSISNSMLINYKKGVKKNWGIEQVPQAMRGKFEQINCIKINGKIIKQKCQKCKKNLFVEEFYKKGNHTSRICKYCHPSMVKVKSLGKLTEAKELASKGIRRCSICKKLKNLNKDFGKYSNGFMGKTNSCKDCVKILNAKYRKIKLLLTTY